MLDQLGAVFFSKFIFPSILLFMLHYSLPVEQFSSFIHDFLNNNNNTR